MSVRLPDHVSLAHTDDGGVLLDERAGKYWEINQSASTVLRMLLDGASEREAATALIAEAGPGAVSLEAAVADVRELLAQLAEADLAVTS